MKPRCLDPIKPSARVLVLYARVEAKRVKARPSLIAKDLTDSEKRVRWAYLLDPFLDADSRN
jgi:hypothetical protein